MAQVVVTALDAKFRPGLVALANSIGQNSPSVEIHAYTFGEVEPVAGVTMIPAPKWDIRYPVSDHWPESSQPSMSRLMLPRLYDERIVWIDADSVVVGSLAPLFEMSFKEPVATVYLDWDTYRLGFCVPNVHPSLRAIRTPFNATMVFNTQVWNDMGITEQCAAATHEDLYFRFVDQSVLGYVLKGNFHRLDMQWSWFANRKWNIPADAKILHWPGGLPWADDIPNAERWLEYGEHNPDGRSPKPV